jgi:hypothetical protein
VGLSNVTNLILECESKADFYVFVLKLLCLINLLQIHVLRSVMAQDVSSKDRFYKSA